MSLKIILINLSALITFSLCRCPLPGPAYQRLSLQASDPALGSLYGNLSKAIQDSFLSTGAWPIWDVPNTSFSVQVTSSEETLWTYHHTASHLGEYVDSPPLQQVDGDTVYRIASISKIFTVLALLIAEEEGGKGLLHDSITKFLPELRQNEESSIDWEVITLEALASQLSGIPRDYQWLDLSRTPELEHLKKEELLESGFPELSEKDIPSCDWSEVACAWQNHITGLRDALPTFEPFELSTYSNENFILLGQALEKIMKMPYGEIIQTKILDPLGMRNTHVEKPLDSKGVIPDGKNYWHSGGGGIFAPTAGFYSTTNDLSKLHRGIFTHQLVSKARTNAWFKPRSFEGGLKSFYGMGWEIFHTDELSSTGRATTIFTKLGTVPGYHSRIHLIPEYNIAVTILIAAKEKDAADGLRGLENAMLTTLLLQVEKVASQKAKEQYAGRYVAADKTMNSSMTLEVLEDTGITIKEWISNGTDFLWVWKTSIKGTDGSRKARLLRSGALRDANEEVWGIDVDQSPEKTWLLDDFCETEVDHEYYGFKSLHEILFFKEHDKVKGMRIRALRQTLVKLDEGETSQGSRMLNHVEL